MHDQSHASVRSRWAEGREHPDQQPPWLSAVPGPVVANACFASSVGVVAPRASWLAIEDSTLIAEYDADRLYSSASMIKTLVLAAVLAEVEAGACQLEQLLAINPEHRADGAGVLGRLPLPMTLRLRDVLELMIVVSDNTATNAVLGMLGVDRINRQLERWDYASRVCGYAMDRSRRWSGTDRAIKGLDMISSPGLGLASASEHSRLIMEMKSGRLLPRLGDLALEILAGQQDRTRLARHIPRHERYAGKTGTIDRVRHDGGLLELAGRRLLIGCFTDGGARLDWPDHPVCAAMGIAIAWLAQTLGIATEPEDFSPSLPSVLVGVAGDLDPAIVEQALRLPACWSTHLGRKSDRLIRAALSAEPELDTWTGTILEHGRFAGLIATRCGGDSMRCVRLHEACHPTTAAVALAYADRACHAREMLLCS